MLRGLFVGLYSSIGDPKLVSSQLVLISGSVLRCSIYKRSQASRWILEDLPRLQNVAEHRWASASPNINHLTQRAGR